MTANDKLKFRQLLGRAVVAIQEAEEMLNLERSECETCGVEHWAAVHEKRAFDMLGAARNRVMRVKNGALLTGKTSPNARISA